MDNSARAWFASRTFGASCPLDGAISRLKAASGQTVSLCLPALDEEATIGPICRSIRERLMHSGSLVDELIVMDSGSTDRTAERARAEGARVVRAEDVDVGANPPAVPGKGEAMWKSLAVATGDIVVWADADTRNFQAEFITALIAPLLADESLVMTKGFYDRPRPTLDGTVARGGRVTEIATRPLFALFHPRLTGFVQPLAGEYAMRRAVARSVPFVCGYGVEAGLLIDVTSSFGLSSVAQIDLGSRLHRTRDLHALGRAAVEIQSVILARAGFRIPAADDGSITLPQFEQSGLFPQLQISVVPLVERPPMNRMAQPDSGSAGGTTEGGESLWAGRA